MKKLFLILNLQFAICNLLFAVAPTAQPKTLRFFSPPNIPSAAVLRSDTTIYGEFDAVTSETISGGYLVLRSTTTFGLPVDETTYTVGQNIGAAKVVAVLSPAAFNFSATGLTNDTKYNFQIIAFNIDSVVGTTTYTKYNTTSPLVGRATSLKTEPTASADSIKFTAYTDTSISLSWKTAGAGINYMVLRNTVNSFSPPIDGTEYAKGNTIGTATIAFMGTATNFKDMVLLSKTTYYYQVYTYSGTGKNHKSDSALAAQNYRATSPATGFQTTFAKEPTASATNLTFTGVTDKSMIVNWTASAGGADKYLVSVKGNLTKTAKYYTFGTLKDRTTFQSVSFGNLTGPPGGDSIVYNSSSTSSFVMNMTPKTYYCYTVYPYNVNTTAGGNGSENYKLSAPLRKCQWTLSAKPTGGNFTAVNQKIDSLQLKWSKAQFATDTGYVYGYYLAYDSTGIDPNVNGFTDGQKPPTSSGSKRILQVDSLTFDTIISGLNPCQNYVFRIIPFIWNNINDSTYSYNTTLPTSYSSFPSTSQPLDTTPSMGAKDLMFHCISSTEMRVDWMNGNGTRRIVVAKEGAAPTWKPVDSKNYNGASTFYSSAKTLDGNGNRLVYDGTGNSITLKNLEQGKQYFISVFEYNGNGPDSTVTYYSTKTNLNTVFCHKYNTDSVLTGTYKIIYVNDTMSNDALDGLTPATAKKTIQSADSIACDSLKNIGYIVSIAGGTYNEHAVIHKSLTFISTDGGDVLIDTLEMNGNAISPMNDTLTIHTDKIIITSRLTLTEGIIHPSNSTNYITMYGNGANANMGSPTSYNNGPLAYACSDGENQNATINFPIGKGATSGNTYMDNNHRPISIFMNITSTGTQKNNFIVEAMNANPQLLPGLALPANTGISDVRYYSVNRTFTEGTINNAQITLPYYNDNDYSDYIVNQAPNIRILQSEQTQWKNLGGNVTQMGALGGKDIKFYNDGKITANVSFDDNNFFAMGSDCSTNPLMTPDFTAPNTCAGTQTIITNNSTVEQLGGIVKYNWDFGFGGAKDLDSIPSTTYPYEMNNFSAVYPAAANPNTANTYMVYTYGLLPGFYEITLTAKSNLGCETSITNPIVIYPVPIVKIDLPITTPAVCNGNAAQFKIDIKDVPVGQDWELIYSTTNPASQQTLKGKGSGIFGPFTTVALVNTGATAVNAVISLDKITNTTINPNGNSCVSIPNVTATVVVEPSSSQGTLTGAATVCSGNNSGTLTLTGNTGTARVWQKNEGSGFVEFTNTEPIFDYKDLTKTTEYRVVVQSSSCVSATSNVQIITVQTVATASIVSSTPAVCGGNTGDVIVNINNAAGQNWTLTYLEGTITKTKTGTGNGNTTITTAALNSSTDISLQSIATTSGVPLCTNNNLTGTIRTTIVVNPVPQAKISSGNANFCIGSSVTFSVDVTNVAGFNSWELYYNIKGVAQPLYPGNGAGRFNITTGNINSTATIILDSIVSKSGSPSCNNTSLNSSVIYTAITTTAGGKLSPTQAITCSGGGSTIILSQNNGTILRWEYSYDGNAWFNINNTGSSLSYNNISQKTYYRVVSQNAPCAIGYSDTATVMVNPLPQASMSGSVPVCSGDPTFLNVQISNVGVGERWILNYKQDTMLRSFAGTGPGSFSLQTAMLMPSPTKDTAVFQTLNITNVATNCTNNAIVSNTIIKIITSKESKFAAPDKVCVGKEATFSIDLNVGIFFQWEFSDSSKVDTTIKNAHYQKHIFLRPDTYEVSVFYLTREGCTLLKRKNVIVYPAMKIKVSNDTILQVGATVKLKAEGGELYKWTPKEGLSDENSFNPLASPKKNTMFVVTATDSIGCTAMDSVWIEVNEHQFEIYNTITPNGDGINDLWLADSLWVYPSCELFIFNRYGQEVYKIDKTAEFKGWDGTRDGNKLPDGAYYYILQCPDLKNPYKGVINLLGSSK